jgi:hypothetical protein
MVIRLVRKEVPQMSDRSSDDPSFGRAFTPAVFSRPGKYVKYRTRARVSGNAKTAIPGVIIRAMEERPIWVGR